jgi:hypothetical protein
VTRAAAAALATAALLSSACDGEEPPRTPANPPASATAAARGSDLSSGAWGDFRSKRFDMTISLPDVKAWRIDDHSTLWLEAKHAPSGSTLSVRLWNEDSVVNRDRCEARARGWKTLPPRDGTDVLRREPIPVPPDFDTVVELGVVAPRPGVPLQAVALAFGGWAHRCFAFVYQTVATGPGAEQLIGARLAAMVDGTLANTRFESDLVPRIPREPVRRSK